MFSVNTSTKLSDADIVILTKTSDKCILVTNGDGTQSIVTVNKELGMKSGNESAIRETQGNGGVDRKIMTTYVVDIETKEQTDGTGCDNSNYTKYFFKIDTNGNVDISTQLLQHQSGRGTQAYEKKKLIKIDDNIPVPNYFIEIINSLILQVKMGETEERKDTTKYFDNGIYKHIYKEYWEMVIDTIVRIKMSLKETTKNPKDYFGFKQQLNSYIVKSNLQQERILELEKKIKNIQSTYNDTLIDNNKKENNSKKIKLGFKIKKEPTLKKWKKLTS
jgi:hypothetical protein